MPTITDKEYYTEGRACPQNKLSSKRIKLILLKKTGKICFGKEKKSCTNCKVIDTVKQMENIASCLTYLLFQKLYRLLYKGPTRREFSEAVQVDSIHRVGVCVSSTAGCMASPNLFVNFVSQYFF